MTIPERVFKSLFLKFDLERLRTDVCKIMEQHPNLLQIGLTHSAKEQTELEKITECTGSIYDYDIKTFRFKETDMVIFNEAYIDTYIHEVYKAFDNIGRVRIMVMNGPACYTIHKDLTERWHFAIDTNPNCYFVFPECSAIHHIPADGIPYSVDTRYKHTFVNGSRERRIHLVFDDITRLK